MILEIRCQNPLSDNFTGRTTCSTIFCNRKSDHSAYGCLSWVISTCKFVCINLICGNWFFCLPPSCEGVWEIHFVAFHPLFMSGVGKHFLKRPDSKYFGVQEYGSIWLCCHNTKTATDDTETNEWGCVPIKHFLWTLKFEYHKIFTCHKIFFFWFFPTT